MNLSLKTDMNWINIERYIIQEKKLGISRSEIESNMMKAFNWTIKQVADATNPHY